MGTFTYLPQLQKQNHKRQIEIAKDFFVHIYPSSALNYKTPTVRHMLTLCTKYLSPLAVLSGNLHARHILEVDSVKHILSILVNNNNILLDGRTLYGEEMEKEEKVRTSFTKS